MHRSRANVSEVRNFEAQERGCCQYERGNGEIYLKQGYGDLVPGIEVFMALLREPTWKD